MHMMMSSPFVGFSGVKSDVRGAMFINLSDGEDIADTEEQSSLHHQTIFHGK